MGNLSNKSVIITGAGTGIGESIALAFSADGAKVVLAGRRKENLETVASNIVKSGGTALCVPTDISVESEVINLFEQATKRFGDIDILVNNAGVAANGAFDALTLEKWLGVLSVNLTGAFLCSREAFKKMKEKRSGRIINIGSTSAKVPRAQSAAYTTTKFGLEGLTRSLALDGREFGIAVSIVHPGNTESQIWGDFENEIREKEGLMAGSDLARVVLLMASLPSDINILESLVLPLSMPFLGRG